MIFYGGIESAESNYVQRARGVEWTRESRPWAVAAARSRRWTSWERVSRTCVSSSSLASREEKMEGSRRDGGGADMVVVMLVMLMLMMLVGCG